MDPLLVCLQLAGIVLNLGAIIGAAMVWRVVRRR